MQTSRETVTHVVLLAHGSPAPEMAVEFVRFAGAWGAFNPGMPVHQAFLSLGSPTLDQALDGAVAQGARRIAVVPLLLFSGKHLLNDVPRAIEGFKQRHPEVEIQHTASLATWPDFIGFLAKSWAAHLDAGTKTGGNS